MGDKDLITFGAAIAADVLSALSVPGGSTLALVAQSYIEKKRREAVGVLIHELSNGFHGPIQFDDYDIDPLIDMMYRFSRAVESGTAIENLRMIAQVMAGLKRRKSMDTDMFRKWCTILESLSRNEMIVIGVACKLRRDFDLGRLSKEELFYWKLKSRLESSGLSESEVSAICCSLTRTGLLVPMSTHGGIVYADSPWVKEIGELANFYENRKS